MLGRLTARLSLHARLLIVAGLTSLIALLFAAYAIGGVLERFVVRSVDRTLDTQIGALADAVTPDARLDPARLLELPAFKRPQRGWSWRVSSTAGEWNNRGVRLAQVDLRTRERGRERWHGPERRRRWPIEHGLGRTTDGEPVHLRQLRIATPAGPVEIIASAPRSVIDRPYRAALPPLLGSLALLGLGLALATWVQLRYGLRPLRDLSAAVARVRSGAAPRLPADQPAELRPLVQEVNALIDQNEAGLEHARRHLSNLAHGLKTPLATLSLQLARENVSAETRALVEQLDQRIAHHLRRARSAAPGAGGRARSDVAEVIADLVTAMHHVHVERRLAFETRIDPALHVAVDRQDLDEMLGNLLDNACRHALGRVAIAARAEGATVAIVIADDGRGMGPDEIARAVRPGERLDESEGGYGFGLSIVSELADLYGGRLLLERAAALGGLAATVTLPAG